MSTDEQSQMVDDISSILMRRRYGRSGVGRPSDNPLDLADARRIVEYVTAHDARVRRDAAAEAWADCVSMASALGHLDANTALEMLDRNPHPEETP